ncbi:MAG: hypothetical protein KDD35_03615 [Bdellovibrionales bacterium]|nr:hypothetical protein [Bdellovibrionales bacterium]
MLQLVLKKSLFVAVLHLCFPLIFSYQFAHAADFNFDNIDQSDLKKIIGDFSGNFTHTNVSGAGSLGKLFGFELGLGGGASTTPGINSLVKETDPNASEGALIHGGLLAQVSVPFGLSVEASLIPSTGGDDLKISNTGIGIKWTMTDAVFNLPFHLALKASATKTTLDFATIVNNASTGNLPVDSKMEFSSSSTALSLIASKDLLIFEPYFGLGMVQSSGDLAITGAGNVFDTTLTASQSASAKTSGVTYFVGSELKLIFLKLGVEYSKVIDVTRVTGKLALYF